MNNNFTIEMQQANLQSIRTELSKIAAEWESERAYYKDRMHQYYSYAERETAQGREDFHDLNYFRDQYRHACKMTERYAKNIKEIKFLLKNLVWMRRNVNEWNEEAN